MKSLRKALALPLVFVGVFLSLYAIWVIIDLPPEETLFEIAKAYFDEYGVVIVFVAALLEGLFLIGWYFPGTLVIVLALVLAAPDAVRVAVIAGLAVLGLCIAYAVNYFIGKHGWYRMLVAFGMREPLEQAQRRLTKHGLAAIFLTYWQLNLASLTSTAAGILHFSFERFFWYSVCAATLWMGFWSSLIYLLGPAATNLVGIRFILALIGVWIVVRLFLYLRARRAADGVSK